MKPPLHFTEDEALVGQPKSVGNTAFAFLIGISDVLETEILAVGQQAQENRLHDVLGIALAAGDAEGGLEDIPAVDAEQLFELRVGGLGGFLG